MQTRRLGRSGLQVSEIALGSWLTLGSRVDYEQTAKLVRHAFDLGINFFDSADVYAQGEAEVALGKALSGIPRHHVVVATKCFFAMSDHPNDQGLSRKHVVESVEGSLRRLGTDYIDLHQCHRSDPDTPIEETVRAYEDLIRQGKLLYWGLSQWSADEIREACAIADHTGGYRPISSQPEYSIIRRAIEAEILPACEAEGLGQIVFSPLGQGVLTGKYSAGERPESSRAGDAKRNRWMDEYLDPELVDRVDRLRPLAEREGLSLAQLALAWCLQRPGVSSALIGATRPEQIEENVAAAGARLSEASLARIDEIFPGSMSDG